VERVLVEEVRVLRHPPLVLQRRLETPLAAATQEDAVALPGRFW
jgi:hypothetical protein